MGEKIKLRQMDIYECIAIAKERNNKMDEKSHKYAGNEKYWGAVDLVALGYQLGVECAEEMLKANVGDVDAANKVAIRTIYDGVRDTMNYQYEEFGRKSGATEDDHEDCEKVLMSLLEDGLKSDVERPLSVMLEILGK